MDTETGKEVWRWAIPAWDAAVWEIDNELSYPDSLTVTVDGDHAYVLDVGASGNELAAIDLADGVMAWTVTMPRAGGSAPVVAGDTLYLARQDGGIYALATADGRQRWRLDTGRRFLLSPVVTDGRLVTMTADGYVFGIGEAGDAATPVATGADPFDISGLSPCIPPRTLPELLPTGAPTLPSLVESLGIEPVNGMVALADLPTSPAADGDAIVGILNTLRAMPPCARPGRERDLAAFYSDDYLRRALLSFGAPGVFSTTGVPWLATEASLTTLRAPVALPDGRVGLLLVDERGETGSMLVFVEQDGHWLIDELIWAAEDPTISRG